MRPTLHCLSSLPRLVLPPLLAMLASWSVAAPTYRAHVIAAPQKSGDIEFVWYGALDSNRYGTTLLTITQYASPGVGFLVYDKDGNYLRPVGGYGRYGGNLCTAINDWGDVAGHDWAGYYWYGHVQMDQGFSATIHGFPEGVFGGAYSMAYAYDLSENGHVVGQAEGELDNRLRGYVWRDKVMQEIGTFGGATSVAVAVNKNGIAVGQADLADGSVHAFVFRNGLLRDLGTFGGANSWASGINDRGQIVGTAQQADGTQRAFIYHQLQMTAMPTPEGSSSQAQSINRQGQVVGSYTLAGQSQPFLFDEGIVHRLQDLLTPHDAAIWTIKGAVHINDKGWILVNADKEGYLHSTVLLLRPVR